MKHRRPRRSDEVQFMHQATGNAPIIVFEGIDGSGKGTQAQLCYQRLLAAGRRVESLSFPRYQETFFGARIGEFLNGDWGTLDQLDPFLISLLYAGDRFESRTVLEQARLSADVIVLDRYVPSNIAHQTAKTQGTRRDTLQQWIEHIEYQIFGLPKPDVVFLLDLPVEISQQLIRRKQRRSYTEQSTDLQESDVAYLGAVREVYRELADRSGWKTISLVKSGALRSVENISDEIWEHVRTYGNCEPVAP